MAAKKAAPKKSGASDKAKKAQSKRMNAQALSSWRNAQPERGNEAAGGRLSQYEQRNRGAVYSGKQTESGKFWSTGLSNKQDLNNAREQANNLKAASQRMKQGVTKSGGYSKSLLGLDESRLRRTKSAKFKAEQAVKKSGGSMSRNARGKTTKRNAK